MKLTLARAKEQLRRFALTGLCATDPRLVEQINNARERLMGMETRWKGMVRRFVFNLNNGCITLPREILTLEGAQICGTRLPIRNHWFEVQDGGPGNLDNSCLSVLQDRGDGHATFVDICAGSPRLVRVYCDVEEAAGARILIQGFDSDGNRVQTSDAGSMVDGEYVSLNNTTPQTSTTLFSSIDGIVKPDTNGFVRLYGVDPDTAQQSILSILHPDDTTPSYRRYFLPNMPTVTPQQLMIVAVLRYLPVKRDTDDLIIGNVGALQRMLQALNAEDANNMPLAIQHQAAAEQILTRELRGFMGDSAVGSMSVQTAAFGAGEIPCVL